MSGLSEIDIKDMSDLDSYQEQALLGDRVEKRQG